MSRKGLLNMLKSLRRKRVHYQRHPKIISRSLGLTLLAKNPGDILHSDLLYVNKSGYILTVVDSLSRKAQLTHAASPTSSEVVKAIMLWRSNFGLNDDFILVTDNGSHYANIILEELQESFRSTQRFYVAYAPCCWKNQWTHNKAFENFNLGI